MTERKKIPRRLRNKLLVDAMNRCCLCPEHPDVTDLHHVVPISEGGPDTEENLMVICPNCHAKIHRLRKRYTVEQLRMYKDRWVTLCGLGLSVEQRLAQASDHTRPPEPYVALPQPIQRHVTGGTPIVQVFVSSAAEDLAEFREVALGYIEKQEGYRCIAEDMKLRRHSDGRSRAEQVTACDLFVAIVGHFYGGSQPATYISHAVLEYESAKAAGKPCVVVLASSRFLIPAHPHEADDQWQRQREFRERVQGEPRLYDFTSREEFISCLSTAIHSWEREQERTLIPVVERLLWPQAVANHATQGFRNMSHDTLVERLRTAIEAELGQEGRVSVFHSLDEAGCDIQIDLPQECVRLGLQVKSHGDVGSRDFTRDTLAQVQDSHRHGLKRLYVLLAGDLTCRSQYQKVKKLESRINQMRDQYVTVIPPETLWVIVGEGPPTFAAEGLAPRPRVPMEPCLAHPYALQSNFTGRVTERRMLTEWLTGDGEQALALIAFGGTGKSALAWAWLLEDVLGQALPGTGQWGAATVPAQPVPDDARPDGVMWWSFYEAEAGFGAFLDEAIAYVSGGRVQPSEIPTSHAKAMRLAALLRQRRILLVLDGFERELRAYAALSAAYQGDSVDEGSEDDFRECVDPVLGEFLGWITSLPMQSRVLVTSRLLPRELEGTAGCVLMQLSGVSLDDAVRFFEAEGVVGASRAEIKTACARYGYHPLALRLLAGRVVHDPERPGDISVAKDYDVADGLKQREHEILPLAYNALDKPKRRLLSRLAAFRSPVAYDAIRVVGGFDSERDLKAALRDLVDRGLLFPESAPAGAGRGARHDMHPIVRQYAYDRLADKDRQSVHGRLRDYFAAAPKPDEDQIETLDDLEPTIELYHHTVRAGQYDEASKLFYDRLNNPLYYRFGAYQTFIELLRGLFADGEDRPPRLKSEADQAWTLAALANAYSLSGQPRKAVGAFERANAIEEKLDDKKNLAIGLGNLAGQQVALGELKAAEGHLRRRIALCREVGDEFKESVGHQQLGRLLACTGRFDEAEEELRTSTRYWETTGDSQGLCLDESYRALCGLWMGQAEAALAAAGKAMAFWEETARKQFPYERDRIRAEWLLGAASVALAGRERARAEALLGEAEGHLHEALTRCRRINMVDHEADILLAWAAWHRLRGDRAGAGRDAGEALAIAERSEYRLTQADAHNLLARLALDAGDRTEARRHAAIAREKALCDGPPDHTYQPALQEAKRLLE